MGSSKQVFSQSFVVPVPAGPNQIQNEQTITSDRLSPQSSVLVTHRVFMAVKGLVTADRWATRTLCSVLEMNRRRVVRPLSECSTSVPEQSAVPPSEQTLWVMKNGEAVNRECINIY